MDAVNPAPTHPTPHPAAPQVQRLALPHQAFSFTNTELNLLDDPGLATAFSVSLRTTFAQVPNAVSTPEGEVAGRVAIAAVLS
jgi:hypothetical protein